jgi:hypothetical protein
MNFRFTVVETALNRAEFRWKGLRFLRYTLLLGSVLGLVALGFGLVVWKGWVTNQALATLFFITLGSAGFLTWVALAILVYARVSDRDKLGAALERVDRRLLDRLNTLLFLERHRADPRAESFARRIARQTQLVAAEKPLAMPFASSRPTGWFLALLAVLAVNLVFYRVYAPLDRLVSVSAAESASPVKPEVLASQLELPETNHVERGAQWGEVRITDPGRDIKVTRLALVPLQIEAAANQPLTTVSWYSAINGGETMTHSLPAPKEPRYAAYQPSLDLGELTLTNWDVVSYYARASTENSNDYVSQVYFIEVRPFREELLGMPGGEEGKAYEFMKALSGLISGQEEVIRQTHDQLQTGTDQSRKPNRQKLAATEYDLGGSARNLQAEMAGSLGTAISAESLENLARAEKSLERAGKRLDENAVAEATRQELVALSELAAARREFQRSIDQKGQELAEKTESVSSNQLSQIAEFRDESRAAQDFVKRAIEQQKGLEQALQQRPSTVYPAFAPRQRQLAQAVKDFQGQHPQVFRQNQQESTEAEKAMNQAAEALQQRRQEAPAATREAGQKLEQLKQAMQERNADRQLADAYKLKRMLDQQMTSFGECANPGGAGSAGQLQQTAAQARNTVSQLRKIAEEEPTRDSFGEPLRQALSGQNKIELDTTLNRLQQPLDEAAQKQGAAAAKEALGKVSQAFAQSEPSALRASRQRDSLQPPPEDRLSQGIADLNSLIKQLEKGNTPSSADRGRQGREALVGIQDGLRREGGNERGNQMLARSRQMMEAQQFELGDLKKLLEDLQVFSLETSEVSRKPEHPEVTNIDSSRMPPAYRGRIQKYFQKLSEQKR